MVEILQVQKNNVSQILIDGKPAELFSKGKPVFKNGKPQSVEAQWPKSFDKGGRMKKRDFYHLISDHFGMEFKAKPQKNQFEREAKKERQRLLLVSSLVRAGVIRAT